MKLWPWKDPFLPEEERPSLRLVETTEVGNTLIMLRNTYGRSNRWTNLSVQEIALRLRNSEPIPLVEGDWLSPWNIDTYMSKEKFEQGESLGSLGRN